MAGSATFRVTNPEAPRREVDPGISMVASQLATAAASRAPVRSGRLRAGWSVAKTGDSRYTVANPVRYAKYVEYGTRKMPARPMLAPALLAARQRYG